jgi:hypothetical protein
VSRAERQQGGRQLVPEDRARRVSVHFPRMLITESSPNDTSTSLALDASRPTRRLNRIGEPVPTLRQSLEAASAGDDNLIRHELLAWRVGSEPLEHIVNQLASQATFWPFDSYGHAPKPWRRATRRPIKAPERMISLRASATIMVLRVPIRLSVVRA